MTVFGIVVIKLTYMLYKIIFSILLVEAITELITKSNIFIPVRKFFFVKRDNKLFKFIHDLFDCSYCTSVWVGFFISIVFMMDLLNNFFFIGIVLHRLSNILHFLIDRVREN